MTDDDPVSWRGLIYGTRVLASDGQRAGIVREVLGSDEEDVFHGIRVGLDGQRRDVMVAADRIDGLSDSGVRTALTIDELRGLPAYDEEATYHLASVGWLRRHLGWAPNSRSDEEAG